MVLQGGVIRLEPLELRHADDLAVAAAAGPSLYRWSPVPKSKAEAISYIELALAWKQAARAIPFVIVRVADSTVIGSTRFFDIERWSWPAGHPSQGRAEPDACEIGYTWLTRCAIRTAVNTEAKLLMLTHAFETWRVVRVCLHTDVRNERSRAAMERMGARFEGILRSHRMAADFIPRDSARYSIVAADWPGVKERCADSLCVNEIPE